MTKEQQIHEIFRAGGLVCEYTGNGFCCDWAKAYIRTEKDAKDWPNKKVPIALCDKHKGKRKLYEKTNSHTLLPYGVG